ncbi:unnamed protein product [Ixodes persulcatus]
MPAAATNGECDAASLASSAEDSGKGSSSTSSEEDAKLGSDATPGQELVFIQDTGFNVKIAAPGLDPFDIQVSSMELVQEIHQLLMDREDTCHRTCFSLQLDGATLDNFAELKNIPGLQEGSLVKVVEEPYTVREARIHVRHVRDLLKSLDAGDAYNGIDCSSLAFLNVVTQGDILEASLPAEKKSRAESVDCTPPDYIIPGSKEPPPLVPLLPQAKEQKNYQALKVLTTSGWNPPPGPRKLHGDLMYLYVVTLEDKRYHITASTRGFYVNESTEEEFNPRPSSPKHVFHSLVDLLGQVSASFKRNFALIQKKRTQRHPFERVATPYQVYSWLAPPSEHSIDSIRAEDGEELLLFVTRETVLGFSSARRLLEPASLRAVWELYVVATYLIAAPLRISSACVHSRQRSRSRLGAECIYFLMCDLCFILGTRKYYAQCGTLARRAPSVRGKTSHYGTWGSWVLIPASASSRLMDQTIHPGRVHKGRAAIFHSAGQPVVGRRSWPRIAGATVRRVGVVLGLLSELAWSVESWPAERRCRPCGFDRKKCVRQLRSCRNLRKSYDNLVSRIRVFFQICHTHFFRRKFALRIRPPSWFCQCCRGCRLAVVQRSAACVQPLHISNGQVVTGCKSSTRHQVATLEKQKTIGQPPTHITSQKEVIAKAAQGVGSLKDNEFDIRFNPDVFSPGSICPCQEERLKKEQRLVKEAADFLVADQLPAFVKDCADHSCSPIDGITLSEAMHSRGINMRYLGRFADMVAPIEQLKYLHGVAVAELITRAAKHLLTTYLQGVDASNMATAISHFLNCFLAAPSANVQAPMSSDEVCTLSDVAHGMCPAHSGHIVRVTGSIRLNRDTLYLLSPHLGRAADNTEWTTLSPRSLWEQLRGELHSYYGWEFPAGTHVSSGCPEDFLESLGVHKCVLLRSLCLKGGLQLLHREYALEQRTRAPFTEEDVVNVFPVAKHVHPRATDAYSFYLTGQGKIQQGLLREGYELISEALNLMNNVYGAMHPEIAQCLRLLARLNYVMGDYVEAMAYQQKAVLMSERVNGIDHPYTITEYTHLALYCFANSQVTTTLKLLYRARYLMLLVCGELHPEMPVLDSNIGLILHAVGEYDLSLRFLENALQLNIKFYGSRSLKVAVSYHLVARAQSCLGDFRGALHNEKETYAIYKAQLGEEHDKTRESSECLRHLTQQAVVLQKKINDIYKKNTSAALPPIQIQAPSQSNVLEMLNIINGILFVQIRPQDIENFKAELERRQQQASSGEVEKHAVTAGKESNCVVETPTTAEVAAETSR